MVEWCGGDRHRSPFPPVSVNGRSIPIDQTNNSYVFPGVALGVISSQARRVTDSMFMAAAKTLAGLSPTEKDKQGRLLPPVTEIRSVSIQIAMAVAQQARKESLALLPPGRRPGSSGAWQRMGTSLPALSISKVRGCHRLELHMPLCRRYIWPPAQRNSNRGRKRKCIHAWRTNQRNNR